MRAKLFLLFLTLLVCGGIVEATLRMIPRFLPEPRRSFLQEAARIPFSNRRVHRGFRGGVAIKLPPVEKMDIVVVGDSFPFGTYEKADDTFPLRLGRNTGARVANLGVGSTNPLSYNRMVEVAMRYEPRIILYCIFANDFFYPGKAEVRTLAADRIHADLPGDRDLFTAELGWREHVIQVLKSCLNRIMTYQIFKLAQQPLARWCNVPDETKNHFFMFAPRAYWDDQLSWERADVKRGVDLTARLAHEAHRFAQRQGVALQAVLIPSKEMVYGPISAKRSDVFHESYDRTFAEARSRLKAAAVPVIDLTDGLRAKAREGRKLYHTIDGHFNPQGHEAAARLIQDALQL